MMNPIELVREDREKARIEDDPLVDRCFLATVRDDGEPAVRTLVLRDVNSRYAVFFNATSPKFEEIRESKTVEVLLWYASVQIQYRLRCALQPIPSGIVHDQWQNKPEITRRVDHAYAVNAQSSSIPDRKHLQELVRAQDATHVAPDSVIGFFLEILEIDRLNLAIEEGLHLREKYLCKADGWERQTLMP